MPYKIGSFNVRNLSFAAGKERLDNIANLIKEFDLVALQEVLSEGKMLEGAQVDNPAGQQIAYENSLRYRLGDNWDMCWLDPHTDSKWYPYLGNDSRGEGYAFLWRKDKFRCPVNEYGREVRPRIYRQYKTDSSNGELRLARDPGYGRFQVVNMPNAEIRLVTAHIVYGKPSEDNLSKVVDHGATMMRQKEFNVLARNVYTRISEDYNDINCNIPYTIILGDYNLNLPGSKAKSPYVSPIVVLDAQNNILPIFEIEEKGVKRIHTVQKDLSTINKEGNDYSSNYDHFTYDDHTKNGIVQGIAHRLDVIDRFGDHKTYKENVSDHIPVMLEIDFK